MSKAASISASTGMTENPGNVIPNSGCRFVAVRFGNVLGSSGSVIPIFEQQIADRMPVTVTHPEVMRYFMSTAEAAQLILQAGAMGEGGEVFILKMGRPIKIADMARDLIRLHGLEPDRDVPIRFTGLRPGEKLYEELITEGEGIVPTRHEKIRVIRGRHCDAASLNLRIDELIDLAKTSDIPAIKAKLKEIVPEYTPQ
jgi:FlaA1/EpsC-like NDP-sugar epimerase